MKISGRACIAFQNFRLFFLSKKYIVDKKMTIKINRHADSIKNILDKKIILHNLLENKIYHYSLFSNDTKELTDLKNTNTSHLETFKNFDKTYKLNLDILNTSSQKSSTCIMSKVSLLCLSTIALPYYDFVKFMIVYNEILEESITDLIRDFLQDGIDDFLIKTSLIKLRDDWRNCFNPEVMNENFDPTHNISIISKAGISINENLLKIL